MDSAVKTCVENQGVEFDGTVFVTISPKDSSGSLDFAGKIETGAGGHLEVGCGSYYFLRRRFALDWGGGIGTNSQCRSSAESH